MVFDLRVSVSGSPVELALKGLSMQVRVLW
jgi:hypothetical protein